MDGERNVSILLGNPKKAIVTLAIPLIVSLVVAEVNILADRAWCSGLGSEALASVSVITPLYNTMVGLGSGLGVGAAAVVSRMIGAKKKNDATLCAVQAIIIAILIGLILTPILFFTQTDVIKAIGSDDIVDKAGQYMMCYTVFVSVIIVNGTLAGILNGQGATFHSTVMMSVLAVANIILDPIFIYVLDMGIVGASMATVVATFISLGLGIYFLQSRQTYLTVRKSDLKFDNGHMRSVAVAGIPQMVEYCVLYAMDAVLNLIVINCAGSEGLTIFSTPDKLIEAICIPAMAIGSAVVTVASSAYGQGDKKRMSTAFRYGVRIGITWVIILGAVLWVFAEPALYVYTYTDEMAALRPQMVAGLHVIVLYAPLFSMTPLYSGYLQALRHPNRSVIIAVWRNLVLIACFYVAAQYSLYYIFWALPIGHLIGAITIIVVTRITSKKVYAQIDSGNYSIS